MKKFTLLVDESGEMGIAKVRGAGKKGASPYMTLGGVLFENSARARIEEKLQELYSELGKNEIHCSNLNHYQLVHVCRRMRALPIRFFGVISLKSTLGSYRTRIGNDPKKYYNKCAQFLLERAGYFMECRELKAHQLDIVFEKANCDYDGLRGLVHYCRRNPRHPNSHRLLSIEPKNIRAKKKHEEPLLQMADVVAHALYKCVEKSERNFKITEPRYLRELEPNFFGHPVSNSVIEAGLYCVHSLHQLALDPDVKVTIESLTAKPPITPHSGHS